MFGYITVNKPEMKFKDYDTYRTFYCGLCRQLQSDYGRIGQMSLNFDLTFLSIVLTGLYEPENRHETHRCITQPFVKHPMVFNEYGQYAADMTIVLTYLKCEDDWLDDHRYRSQVYRMFLKGKIQQVQIKYPKKIAIIQECLASIQTLEKQNSTNLDELSKLFGIVMGEIFTYKDDHWKDKLYEMGLYLGRFIYIMDAYDDIEEDIKSNSFNPFKEKFQEDNFEEYAKDILELMIAQCCEAFERLPIIEYSDIMRNILYSGIWSKYEIIKKRRQEEHG